VRERGAESIRKLKECILEFIGDMKIL